MEFWWLVLVAIVTWVLLNRHRLGQNTYVIGDNAQAARLMGIPIRRTRIILFVLTGVAAAFAGVMNSLQVVELLPEHRAPATCCPPLAAVFVGGTSVFGGRGSSLGHVHRGVHDRRDPGRDRGRGHRRRSGRKLIYGGIILVSVSIHAVLQRRFER